MFIFENTYLSISQIKFLLYKSRYSHIRELRCIYPYLDFKTVSSLPNATSIVHSKLDYFNSLNFSL